MSASTNSPEEIVQSHLGTFKQLAESDLPISTDARRALDLVDEGREE
jgi:hypothetical protein